MNDGNREIGQCGKRQYANVRGASVEGRAEFARENIEQTTSTVGRGIALRYSLCLTKMHREEDANGD